MACFSINGHVYTSVTDTDITAASNGGATVTLVLTFTNAVSLCGDNATILKLTCAVAEELKVVYPRVTENFGGYCAVASPLLATCASSARFL